MKKALIFIPIFAAVFILAYLVVSYLPGYMIKLSAPPEIYFIHNLKKLWGLKSIISGSLGLLAGGFTLIKLKK